MQRRKTLKLARLIVGLAVALGLTASLLAVTRPSDAAFSGQNGKIVFAVPWHDLSVNQGIYVVNPDGSGQQRLTSFGADPAWSPDGARIAFVSNGLYVMNADGSNQTQIVADQGDISGPAWSPDGARIVFAADRGVGDHAIHVVNVDGLGLQQLTSVAVTDAVDEIAPAWSPDGARIAFVRYVNGYGKSPVDIYTMNADGSGEQQITTGGNNYSPAWSPDGSKLVFRHKDPNAGAGESPVSGLYVMNTDGSNRQQLTNAAGVGSPVWSANGAQIVYTVLNAPDQELYLMNSDGSGQVQIPNPKVEFGAREVAPDWQTLSAGTPPPLPPPAPTATPAPIMLPPAAPSDLTATALAPDQVALQWFDHATDETSFIIERCMGSRCADFAPIATVGIDITSYTDTQLRDHKVYHYRILAENSAGVADSSNTVRVRTLRADDDD
jgi:TolB protein